MASQLFRIVILNESGTYFVVDRNVWTKKQAKHWCSTWKHATSKAIAVPAWKLEGCKLRMMSDIDRENEEREQEYESYDLEEKARIARASYIRDTLQTHLEQVIEALGEVWTGADVGVIARSLEALADHMGELDEYAKAPESSNAELMQALGFERHQEVEEVA